MIRTKVIFCDQDGIPKKSKIINFQALPRKEEYVRYAGYMYVVKNIVYDMLSVDSTYPEIIEVTLHPAF